MLTGSDLLALTGDDDQRASAISAFPKHSPRGGFTDVFEHVVERYERVNRFIMRIEIIVGGAGETFIGAAT